MCFCCIINNNNKFSGGRCLMNKNLTEKTSKRLYELRTNAGYTMEQLAEMIKVSKGTISKWEKGSIKNMRQDKVLMLANIFHVSPTYIMGYDSDNDNFEKKYNRLNNSDKEIINKMIESLLSKQE